jgi:transcriptional regulator with XRE-family HTH domain
MTLKDRSRRSGSSPSSQAGLPTPADEDAAAAVLAQRLRAQRMRKSMSGRELAAAVNVTPGFISQLERGLSTPSVATLLRICGVLGVQIGDLFTEPRPVNRVVRRNQRPVYTVPKTGFEEARISADPRGNVEVVWSRMSPGGGTGEELLCHGSETECVYILKGKLNVVVGEEEYVLKQGDCLTFPGNMPHGPFNRSRNDVELLWVTVPAVY